jgi:N-formylglutamate deformylase
MGYTVKVNDPYKGVELVRAYSDPARGRHSLQLEINKRLYMDEAARRPHAGFDALRSRLLELIEAIADYIASERSHG